MSVQNIELNTGYETVTFSDLDGHVFSKFRINPTDIKFAKRFEETVPFFEGMKDRIPDNLSEIDKFSDEVGEKISYILGCDAKEDVFGEVPAFTLLGDGTYFIEHVLDKIYDIAKPAIKQRAEAREKKVTEYTAKYEGV